MRCSDWSSDVCSSDLKLQHPPPQLDRYVEIGRGRPGERNRPLGPEKAARQAVHPGLGERRMLGSGDDLKVDLVGELAAEAPKHFMAILAHPAGAIQEARRLGKLCVRPWRSRWARYH